MSFPESIRRALVVASVFFLLVATRGTADAQRCGTEDVAYALNAVLQIKDTTLGAGDGVHAIGPGRAVIRFASTGAARVLFYELQDQFVVDAHYLFASARITTDTVTRATSADGRLEGRRLGWIGDWRDMRSDGVLRCEGNLCGHFGAPPPGTSPSHTPPHASHFNPFEYAEDGKTFRMSWAVESRQESPRETSLVALAGREIGRTCVTSTESAP